MSSLEVVRYHTDTGSRMALVSEGRKRIAVVTMDIPIRRRFVARTERRYMTPTDYPVSKAKRRFRHAAKRLGITKPARRMVAG